jgi:hypothetical protein
VLERAVKGNNFKPGDKIKCKGTPLKGEVLEIKYDIDDVQWRRNQPQFILIELIDGKQMMSHHSQLKRAKK